MEYRAVLYPLFVMAGLDSAIYGDPRVKAGMTIKEKCGSVANQ